MAGSNQSPSFRALLADTVQAVAAALPTVRVDLERFSHSVARLEGPAFTSLRHEDLYLAFACLEGDTAALSLLEERVISQVDRAVVSIDSSHDFMNEVRQSLREKLLVGAAPRLAEYRGEGSLVAWARTVAVRLALNLKRVGAKEQPTGDASLLELSLHGRDMEFDYVRQQHRADFLAALREALASLDVQARNVLRLSFVDHLSIDQLAALYGTHRATAARWVAKARETLVHRTRQALARRLSLDAEQLDSLLNALQSHLEISLRGLLAAD
jgi:RNA polymerase sigma-70 factor, ECF subfamily